MAKGEVQKGSLFFERTNTYESMRFLLFPCSVAYKIVYFFSCCICYVAYVYV